MPRVSTRSTSRKRQEEPKLFLRTGKSNSPRVSFFNLNIPDSFPYKIGYDCAGTVLTTGSQVKRFKAGDEVFVRLPECHRGSWSELARSTEDFVALKPNTISMEEAASIPLACMTALQALRGYEGNLEGKTVFIPAGRKLYRTSLCEPDADLYTVGGTGIFACQLAKNIFRAGKVITTVSTSKVPQVNKLLGEGIVDESESALLR
jgi:NADPH:quinone reductase-like Zn-dependent oxidoreductase